MIKEEFTADGIYTLPFGAKKVRVTLVGAGGGGASGQKTAASGVGGGGGASGAIVIAEFDPADITPTVAVTIGIGGTGGLSQTTDSSNGLPGTTATRTSFGPYMSAGYGTTGTGGGVAGSSNAPGGNQGVNLLLTGISGNQGGTGRNTSATDPGKAANHACTGGGGGGGINAGVEGDGADGQYRGGETAQANGPDVIHAGGTGGTVGATLNGTDGSTFGIYGTGGGGGAASLTANGGNGGHGGRGAGGGGGGACRNTTGNSGAGGNGGDGYCLIETYF